MVKLSQFLNLNELLRMKNPTPLFPGFHLVTLRKTPRSAQQILSEKMNKIKRKSFGQLGECLGKYIPRQHLQPTKTGQSSRRRFYNKENTFWAFFSQILDADGGCKEVVRKLQVYATLKSQPLPSSSTSAYCQAILYYGCPAKFIFSIVHSDLDSFRPYWEIL